MNAHFANQPYLALIDDDAPSARLLMRMLIAHGAPGIDWLGDGNDGVRRMAALLGQTGANLPSLVIVDLKAGNDDTASAVGDLRSLKGGKALTIAALAPDLERSTRELLVSSGANAVFERHQEIGDYRRETASMVSFWVRQQRLNAVGC